MIAEKGKQGSRARPQGLVEDAEVRDTTGSIQPEMPLNVIIGVGGFGYESVGKNRMICHSL